MSLTRERIIELETEFYQSKPTTVTAAEVVEMIGDLAALREENAQLEKEIGVLGQVAESESRERQRLQSEAARQGLFDPRITDHIRRSVPN